MAQHGIAPPVGAFGLGHEPVDECCERVEIAIKIEIRKRNISDDFILGCRVVHRCGKSLVAIVFQNRNAGRAKKTVAYQDVDVSVAIEVTQRK